MSKPTKEFRYVGLTPDTLESGRPVEFGEFTGLIGVTTGKNKQLLDDGLLIEVPKGTADANASEEPEHELDNFNQLDTGDSPGEPELKTLNPTPEGDDPQ